MNVFGGMIMAAALQGEIDLGLATVLLLAGFLALYYGAEWLVEGAVSLANHLKISKVVAGVILVAFGTSAPELFVNSIAAVRAEAGFALSNVSGSNLANLLVGFGLCAVFSGLFVNAKTFRLDLVFFSVTPLLIFTVMVLSPRADPALYQLPLWTALILLPLFAGYIYLTFGRSADDDEEEDGKLSMLASVGYFLLGIALLYAGGEMTVRQATGIAAVLGVPDAILGLTIVALGTSVPDITASIVAARQHETSIAVGNLLGSNIFNVLFVIPVTLLFSRGPLSADGSVLNSFGAVTAASVAFFLLVRARPQLARGTGLIFLVGYVLYIVYRIVVM